MENPWATEIKAIAGSRERTGQVEADRGAQVTASVALPLLSQNKIIAGKIFSPAITKLSGKIIGS